jgi:hypothetical protein
MLTLSSYPLIDTHGSQTYVRPLAERTFHRSRNASRLGWVKALFTGKLRMPTLAKRMAGRAIRGQHSLGLRSVEIDRIVGTESRADDFDGDFNPRHDRMFHRWVRIAELQLSQANLPAVELIQVENEYFVRDGHHRISVARALGSAFIDAQVTRIEVAEHVQVNSHQSDPAALRYAATKCNGESD